MTIAVGSVCSGILSDALAWHELGWRHAWCAEIDPFASRVIAHRWPSIPNLGDFTAIRSSDEPVDLLVGGTPCQSFSAAGLRAGLADPRGNLALEFLALAARLAPRWVVWENVAGVLSSSGGRDFGTFLGGLAELGYGFAYRVLDAQYFGVAQRRRRVFVVGHSGGAWQRAAAVLLERSSLRGDPAPSRAPGTRVAGSVGASSSGRGWRVGADEAAAGHLVGALKVSAGKSGPGLDGAAAGHLVFDEQQITSAENRATVTPGQPAPTLNKAGRVTLAFHHIQDPISGEVSPALGQDGMASLTQQGVRRLTPRECERLMGYPDDYTAIPGASDARRYAVIGNGIAVPVLRWIGERIATVDALEVAA